MANICNNTFYAYSEDSENILTIEEFFKNWFYTDVELEDNTIDACFDSRWIFPEEKMNKLFELIPNKEDIYMRCLSVEYGMDYVAYWICDEDGWRQVV